MRTELSPEWLAKTKKEAASRWPNSNNDELDKTRHSLKTGFLYGSEWEKNNNQSPTTSDKESVPNIEMTLEEVMQKFGLIYKDSYDPTHKAQIIKTKIEERKLCIYLIESDLADHEEEEQYARPYILALRDEIENHEKYIADYEKELIAIS